MVPLRQHRRNRSWHKNAPHPYTRHKTPSHARGKSRLHSRRAVPSLHAAVMAAKAAADQKGAEPSAQSNPDPDRMVSAAADVMNMAEITLSGDAITSSYETDKATSHNELIAFNGSPTLMPTPKTALKTKMKHINCRQYWVQCLRDRNICG